MYQHNLIVNRTRDSTNTMHLESAFLLSMLSPVWRVQLCRGHLFQPGSSRSLRLGPDDRDAFLHAVALASGAEVAVTGGLAGLLAVGRLADLYGMDEVCAAVGEAALERLTADGCADALMAAQASGLGRLAAGCRAYALERFEAVAGTEGLGRLDGATLEGLVGDDGLVAAGEERVLAALGRWLLSNGYTQPSPVDMDAEGDGSVGDRERS